MKTNYQKKLFESIHDEYSAHYYDKESMKYRDLFIYKYLWKDLNLNNKKVAEIASGSGLNSKRLLKKFPRADIFGFDISKYACRDYENLTNKKCYLIDLTKENNFKEEYDFVFVVGGIHHCISDLNNTFENIYSMLKPGAIFSMMEPNKKYALEFLRKIWYQNDKNYFDSNTESPIDHDLVLKMNSNRFKLLDIKYYGGPAYFLIYNSLILRLPKRLKGYIAPVLFLLEHISNLLNFKFLYPGFISQWQKIN